MEFLAEMLLAPGVAGLVVSNIADPGVWSTCSLSSKKWQEKLQLAPMNLLGVFARKEHEVNTEKVSSFAVCRTLGGELSEGVFLGFISRKDCFMNLWFQFLLHLSSGISVEPTAWHDCSWLKVNGFLLVPLAISRTWRSQKNLKQSMSIVCLKQINDKLMKERFTAISSH